jgi:hypothetical protein
MKFVSKRLTYANVMSSIAVFLVLAGGTAFAANQLGKNTVGSKQLKQNAVSSAKIKKEAVTGAKVKKGSLTGADIKLSTLGQVPSAAKAGTATNAGHATSADTATNAGHATSADTATNAGHAATADSVSMVHVFKAGAVPAGASEATAPKIELGSVGPFNFYGKCFAEGGDINEVTYIELTSGEATVGSEDGADFDSDTTGYLLTSTPEAKRQMEEDSSAGPNEFRAESDDEEFQASATDGTEITGEIGGTGAKQGNPPVGNGPFLAGDSCIVGTIAVFGG